MSREETATRATPTAPAPKFDRRRMLAPVLTAVGLIMFTAIAVMVQSPSPGNSEYLSPNAGSDQGASALADELQAAGVDVDRRTDPETAISAAEGGNATLFIPAGEFLSPQERDLLTGLAATDASTRIVAVLPPPGLLDSLQLRADGRARIATGVVDPSASDQCGLSEAADAGPAQMNRQSYVAAEDSDLEWQFCHDSALAWHDTQGHAEVVVAGADAPFSNAHIDEVGNKALAMGLLSVHDTVVWLDQHSLTPEETTEPPPTSRETPAETPEPTTAEPEVSEAPLPEFGSAGSNALYQAFPAWVWPLLVGLLLAGVLAALWAGRRLGPPTPEPLPVTVPAAETIHGRARLYRSARAYPQAMHALRTGALVRICQAMGLSSQARLDEISAAAVARTGWSKADVDGVLFGVAPSSEAEFTAAVQALDALTMAVENSNSQGS